MTNTPKLKGHKTKAQPPKVDDHGRSDLPIQDIGIRRPERPTDLEGAPPGERIDARLEDEITDPGNYLSPTDPSGDESQEWQIDKAERGTGAMEK